MLFQKPSKNWSKSYKNKDSYQNPYQNTYKNTYLKVNEKIYPADIWEDSNVGLSKVFMYLISSFI